MTARDEPSHRDRARGTGTRLEREVALLAKLLPINGRHAVLRRAVSLCERAERYAPARHARWWLGPYTRPAGFERALSRAPGGLPPPLQPHNLARAMGAAQAKARGEGEEQFTIRVRSVAARPIWFSSTLTRGALQISQRLLEELDGVRRPAASAKPARCVAQR